MNGRAPAYSGQGPDGYAGFRQATYQRLGPDEDNSLDQILLVSDASGGPLAQDNVAKFVVKTPSVRCQTRIALVLPAADKQGFIDPMSTASDSALNGYALGCTLWMCARAHLRAGPRIGSPTRNVVGTGAAPLAIPTDNRLWGFEEEFTTAGEEIYGELTVLAGNTPPDGLDWHLAVIYASTVPLTEDEWGRFCQGAKIEMKTPPSMRMR